MCFSTYWRNSTSYSGASTLVLMSVILVKEVVEKLVQPVVEEV